MPRNPSEKAFILTFGFGNTDVGGKVIEPATHDAVTSEHAMAPFIPTYFVWKELSSVARNWSIRQDPSALISCHGQLLYTGAFDRCGNCKAGS
jgi:hypothetical protein